MLETERLRLRAFTQNDAENFAALNANADFTRFLGQGEPIDAAASWRVMATIVGHWQLLGYGLWLVEEKDSGRFVGRVGLLNLPGWPGIEVGWGIAPEFWSRGYAFEAAVAAMRWGFDELKLDELISLIHPDNQASKKLALRVGERFRNQQDVAGKWCDIYTIDRAEFYQRHPA
ncbi:GNAT family N-acetyltransferase [Saccharospirillum sp. MSK14-1]|uniref:GNAT family N-acetyltransferase n=1 Tax=Saccharospirillum sp. MSK14-1 TaxID=1897632 RepID=UPI001304E20C|nr:GNAT family N-acetyltransferase [Saccharospirillum sp. MSK14-1]